MVPKEFIGAIFRALALLEAEIFKVLCLKPGLKVGFIWFSRPFIQVYTYFNAFVASVFDVAFDVAFDALDAFDFASADFTTSAYTFK